MDEPTNDGLDGRSDDSNRDGASHSSKRDGGSHEPNRDGGASGVSERDGFAAPARAVVPFEGIERHTFQHLQEHPLSLDYGSRAASVESLNQLLADAMTLGDMYKKYHWQTSGPTFYTLHLLFDRHAAELVQMVDEIAERIQTLGGVCVAMAADVVEMTIIPRVPRGREDVATQIARLLHAHEVILQESRRMLREARHGGDEGTADMIVSEVIRLGERQVWFLFQHAVPEDK